MIWVNRMDRMSFLRSLTMDKTYKMIETASHIRYPMAKGVASNLSHSA